MERAERSGSEDSLVGGGLGEVWRESGTKRQVLQRRRCRPDNAGTGGGFAVQFCRQFKSDRSPSLGVVRSHTRQTTAPHFLHSPTMSLAHCPTFPLVILWPCHSRASGPLVRQIMCDSLNRSASAAPRCVSSFEHRSDCVTS